ncbi:MAG: CoA transferase [Acidimicrobiales bacterium]
MKPTRPPLDGVRVLEVSGSVAGAFAGRYLRGYGADVVHAPLDVRAPLTSDERGYLHAGKRVVDPEPAAVRALAAVADIVIEDAAEGVLDGWDCAPATLRSHRPDLVVVSVTPFGRTGPYAGYQATNIVAFAMGGIMSVTGDPDRPPLVTGGSQAYYLGGLNAAGAAVAAYYGRLVHGEGDHVEISMQECLAANMELYASGTAYGDPVQLRMGNQVRPVWAIYPCGNRWAGVFCLQRQIPALFALLDDPELERDPRFLDPLRRDEVADELTAKLYAFFAEHTPEEIIELARTSNVPFGVAMTPGDLLASAGLRERAFFDEVAIGGGATGTAATHVGATVTMPGRPFPGLAWRPPEQVEPVAAAVAEVLEQWTVAS